MVELFKGIKVDWLGKRKLFFAISVGLMLVGMASLIYKGSFHYGLDFKGGTLVRVRFNDAVDAGGLRDLLPQANIQAARDTRSSGAGGGGSEFQIELEKVAETEDASAGR